MRKRSIGVLDTEIPFDRPCLGNLLHWQPDAAGSDQFLLFTHGEDYEECSLGGIGIGHNRRLRSLGGFSFVDAIGYAGGNKIWYAHGVNAVDTVSVSPSGFRRDRNTYQMHTSPNTAMYGVCSNPWGGIWAAVSIINRCDEPMQIHCLRQDTVSQDPDHADARWNRIHDGGIPRGTLGPGLTHSMVFASLKGDANNYLVVNLGGQLVIHRATEAGQVVSEGAIDATPEHLLYAKFSIKTALLNGKAVLLVAAKEAPDIHVIDLKTRRFTSKVVTGNVTTGREEDITLPDMCVVPNGLFASTTDGRILYGKVDGLQPTPKHRMTVQRRRRSVEHVL